MSKAASLAVSFSGLVRALACALPLALAVPAPADAEIGAYLLFDMDSGKVLAAHRASTPWYPASLTKLMTAYVTFKAVEAGTLKLTSPVTISPQASQQPPSRMGFSVGTTITVETALRIILTKSANDVSVALAEAVGGTSGQFMDRMNKAAADLGMSSSAYDNPHGLPNAKQVTTARDIAILMRALADEFPDYADYFSMGGVELGGRTLTNHNKLIRRFRGADGMKTGFICASGFNLAASATRGGVRLGAVVLGGLTSRERDERTAELLAKGFEAVASPGRIALDDFGAEEPTLEYAAVTGEPEDLGTVEDLPAANEEVVDLRAEVCGAQRPPTRYADGVVSTREALEEKRAELLAARALRKAREEGKAEILSAPRIAPTPADPPPPLVPPADGPERALADPDLRPADWELALSIVFPATHPQRGAEEPRPVSDFAPDDWIPSPAKPLANPLAVADMRRPLPPEPLLQPLTYMQPSVAKAPVKIAIGGADSERPEPLSGSVVGGGRAPIPAVKPAVSPSITFEPITEEVTEYAVEVRGAVTQSQ